MCCLFDPTQTRGFSNLLVGEGSPRRNGHLTIRAENPPALFSVRNSSHLNPRRKSSSFALDADPHILKHSKMAVEKLSSAAAMNLPSYQFSTQAHKRGSDWVRYPLWFTSLSNNFALSEGYWIDASIELESLDLEEGDSPTQVFRRYQSHFFPSPTNPPQVYASLQNSALSLQLLWYMTTAAYQQADAPVYTPEDEQEIFRTGTFRGQTLFDLWQPGDTVIYTELLNIKFHSVPYTGDPSSWELQLLLEQQKKIQPFEVAAPDLLGFRNPQLGRSNRSTLALTQVDVRPYRPLNPSTVEQVPADLVLGVTPETRTLDQLVLGLIQEIQKPEVGILKASSVQSTERTDLPQPNQLQQGVNLFATTLNQIKQKPLNVFSSSSLN